MGIKMGHNKKDKNLTVLGKETIFSGHLKFSDDLRIDGQFTGSIDGQGNLAIGKTAVCNADFINALSVIVRGQTSANIRAVDKVILETGSKMKGNITASKLKIADDVNFEGAVKMIADNTVIDSEIFTSTATDMKDKLRR